MRKYGLIGRSLAHSFSKEYFNNKFRSEGIKDALYELYPLAAIDDLPRLIEIEALSGLNVTIPYKEEVIPLLDDLDESAQKTGAVNVIKVGSKLTGYNSDRTGFLHSVKDWIRNVDLRAAVLGTGGASKAVISVLHDLGIPCISVSRTAGDLDYQSFREEKLVDEYRLIINTTPLGMYPGIDLKPDIDYDRLGPEHYLFDLVYNPAETAFMQEGKKHGARVKNGLEMLHEQAEEAWRIWNN